MATQRVAPAPSLPHLSSPCPKCGSEDHDLLWIPSAEDPNHERPYTTLPYEEPREHLRVTCRGCGYVWPAAPLDAGDAAQAAEDAEQ